MQKANIYLLNWMRYSKTIFRGIKIWVYWYKNFLTHWRHYINSEKLHVMKHPRKDVFQVRSTAKCYKEKYKHIGLFSGKTETATEITTINSITDNFIWYMLTRKFKQL